MRWIVLLRGVNVGGHGKTPMAELRCALEEAGAENVETYIQSGNLIFDHPERDAAEIAEWISALIEVRFGHRPPALAFTQDELSQIIDANPYDAADQPKFMHFHLFHGKPAGDPVVALSQIAQEGEEATLAPNCLYHWAPGGFGTSKIAVRAERAIGLPTTARNLNTMRKLIDLA